MSRDIRFEPPVLDFDPALANELEGTLVAGSTAHEEPQLVSERQSPLNGYARCLTPEGGILIHYKDQRRGFLVTIARVFVFAIIALGGSHMIFSEKSFTSTQCLLAFGALAYLLWDVARFPIVVSHSVEIRADSLIVDGRDVFYAAEIGDHWPELRMKDDDPDRMTICGICGTRFIEYMTVNRLDDNDKTPEVLAADLEVAMEQLWGRKEVIFAPDA